MSTRSAPTPEPPDADTPHAARIREAMERLQRLEELMYEMLRDGLASTVGGGDGLIATGPPNVLRFPEGKLAGRTPNMPENMTHMVLLSRHDLDALALAQGDVPLHRRLGAGRWLDLVRTDNRPLYLYIDRGLRLRLCATSCQVTVQEVRNSGWVDAGVHAVKSGCGGILLDAKALDLGSRRMPATLRMALGLADKIPT